MVNDPDQNIKISDGMIEEIFKSIMKHEEIDKLKSRANLRSSMATGKSHESFDFEAKKELFQTCLKYMKIVIEQNHQEHYA